MTVPDSSSDNGEVPRCLQRASTWATNHTGASDISDRPGTGNGHTRFSEDLARSGTNMDATQATPQMDDMRARTRTSASSSQPGNAVRAASQSRNRGYSLRRSMFAQNMQKQDEVRGSIMELKPSSSQRKDTDAKNEKVPTVIAIEEADSTRRSSALRREHAKSQPVGLPTYTKWNENQGKSQPRFRDAVKALTILRNRIFGPTELPPTIDGRHVQVGIMSASPLVDERSGKPYVTNLIRSCKYTAWNFLPKQLVAQFSKLANFYFLVVAILQLIPGLSTTGKFTTIVPLFIFVFISMAKEGYEDIRRNRLDKEENESIALVLNNAALESSKKTGGEADSIKSSSTVWTRTKWQDVKVGDVVLLERDAGVPADLVLLHASGAENTAHIETKSLDGETNLKSKKPLDIVQQHCTSESAIARLQADFVVEDPNLDLYKFDGRVTIANQTLPLTLSEVIYRGSILRNTPTATGLVIYSGEECKIRMNANKNPRVKAPTLQAKVNRVVIIVACLVFFVATICSLGYVFWKRSVESNSWYISDAAVPFGQIFTSFVIMFNTMLPLSLYVSLEIVKVAQIFMMHDIDMYDPETDIPMEPKTSTLNEELGQVSYIFSDKTGTLTNNSMKFRKMSIAGTAWLHDRDLQEGAEMGRSAKLRHKKRNVKGKTKSSKARTKANDSTSEVPLADEDIHPPQAPVDPPAEPFSHRQSLSTGRTDDLLEYIRRRPQSMFARKARFFILALALCHTCIPEKVDDSEVGFQASSPDELALVSAAKELGFVVTDRQSNTMTVKTCPTGDEEPTYETYQILDVVEFSSARKRMSILIRLPDGRICLFCKGADTTIRKLLRQSELAAMYIDDIRRKSDARKNLGAQFAMERRASQFSRLSMNAVNKTAVTGRQSSISLGRRHSARESIDIWLKERENDGRATPRSSAYYTPRQSMSAAQNSGSSSAQISVDISRSSFQTDDLEELVDESLVINDNAVFERCFNHIDDFAMEGLRTLVYGHRFIPEEDYQKWKELYHTASTSLTDRQKKIEEVAESIEQQLELTGATAIEDKLQEGVPDAIDRLRRAGIKIWMLTGDKRETAINIGHSARLIKDYSTVMILDQEAGQLFERIAACVSEIQSGKNAHCVIVIDGQTLTVIDSDSALKALFTDLAIAIDSVVCCRASPSQKAGLVKTIRTKVKDSVTLAIGDGANDIAMIQEAHLGIGIAGKEGLQAARTSDYSIAQFRFLLKLLLVHGRWNYVRVCKYTLGTFWKEMVFYLAQATYQRWNGYTGTSLYEPWSLSMFNTLFTSLPVIFMGVFEKDLAPATLLAVPELYNLGQKNRGFHIPLYAWWAFIGAIEAILIYFTIYSIYGNTYFTKDQSLFSMGALVYTCCVTLISLKLQFFELHNKSITCGIAMFLSIGGWYLWNLILSQTFDATDPIYDVDDGITLKFGRNVLWWLTVILVVLAVSIFEISIKSIKTIFFPNDVETFQVYERDLEVKKRFEESAADLMQLGWNRGSKRSSQEIARDEAEQARREAEVQVILNRPRTMDTTSAKKNESANEDVPPSGLKKRQSWQPVDFERFATGQEIAPKPGTRSLDTSELFAKGYGMARKESMK